MSLVLKMATSHYKRWCVLELAKKEPEQLCKVHFARNFTRSQQAEYPFKPGEIPFNGKGAFAKALLLVGLLFLMHFWIVFGTASIADHKHQSVEQVLIFSYLRATFPNSCASVYLWKAKSAAGPGIGNRRFESAIWTLQRDTSQDGKRQKLAREVHFSDETATSYIKEKVNWHIVRFWRTEIDAAEVISVLSHFKWECLGHLPLLGKRRHKLLLPRRDYLTAAVPFGGGRCDSPERVTFWRWIFRTEASDFVWCRWPSILSDLPASYRMGTGASFPSVKRPERESKHSPPSSIEVKKE